MPGPQQFRGVVVAAKRMPKTITVRIDRTRLHPVVGKVQRRSTKMLTHDPEMRANVGDTVIIRNCAPKSAAKRHELLQIVKAAQVVGGVREGVTAAEEVVTLAEAEEERQSHTPGEQPTQQQPQPQQ